MYLQSMGPVSVTGRATSPDPLQHITRITQRFALQGCGRFEVVGAMRFALEHQNPLVTGAVPDEAASVYARAEAVVSIECHSPLIALHNGTPTFYVRQPTDTCKGQMYRDIGMDDWFFEIDEASGQMLWSRLAAIHADPAKARARVKATMAGVQQSQRRMVEAVRAAISEGGHKP